MDNSNSRRSYLVDANFQFRYIKIILMFVIVVTAVGAASAYVILWLNLKKSGLLTQEAFAIIEHGLAFGSFFQLAISIPLILLFGIVLTHRVVGPLKRVEKLLDDIGEGKFGMQLQVREADELKGLIGWLNKTSKKLERLQKEGKIDVRLKD